MTRAREARLHTMIERLGSGEHYFIYDLDTGQQKFEPDSADWFTWLAGHTSFHFKGQYGHCTVRREEKKKHAEKNPLPYWYAYRKAYGQQHKRYLGSTGALTLAKLEEVAGELHTATLGSLPDDQVLTARVQPPEVLDMYVEPTEGHDDFLISLALLTEGIALLTAPAASTLIYPRRLYDQESQF